MPFDLSESAAATDPAVARRMAVACSHAYLPADAGAAAFQTDLGMTARLISVDNTQAYLATNDGHILVAFRGSEEPTRIDGLKDWLLTNALNLLIVPEGPLSTEFAAAGVGAKFHQGFVSAISAIWPALFPQVDAELTKTDRPVWVTGHSLGGALALLGSWLFKRQGVPVHRVVTFGAPMVGNKPTAEAFDREFGGRVARYMNSPDPVPLLPMMSLVANDFSHCQTAMPLGEASEAANLLDYLRAAAGEAAVGLLAGDIQGKVWGGIMSKVNAHFMTDYRRLLG